MMNKHSLLAVNLLLASSAIMAQVTFTDATSMMNSSTHSGGCVGVVDMNGDGLDDIAIMDDSRSFIIEYQNADGSFTQYDMGQVSGSGQWGMAIGDVNNDGHKDLYCGGSYDGVHYMEISAPGTGTQTSLNNGSMFMQCANIADINNDGWVDAMGCHDDGPSRIWINDGSGLLVYNDYIDFTTNPPSDMSGNYGSCWTDYDNDGDLDMYIAKCRQGVNDPTDPRRINVLYENDGNNNFTNVAAARGVAIGFQSWSADFGDIDNDGDFDLIVTNHDHNMQLFENDGAGNFTEITAGSGLEDSGFFLQSIFRDFDNDGFLDLLIGGGVEGLYMNNGNKTFTQASVPAGPKTLHSFGLGDLNMDGFVDVFASYGDGYITADPTTPDRLWLNDGNANHWLAVNLEGVVSNRDAIGARTEIYGPWGVQVREVRAGESYGIVNSFTAHFGLGTNTAVDSVVVRWPSGQVDSYANPPVDDYITLVEGICIAPTVGITTNGAPIYCTGGTPVELTANAGFNYLWSNGLQTQTISVTQGGSYSVTIDDGNGCAANGSINVAQDPDETPTISLDNDEVFCEGGQVTLTASEATGILWSTNATTQSIVVDQTGSYTVTYSGVCNDFTSDVIDITVLDTPPDPTASNVNLPGPGTADLTATGDSIVWYDVATGGSPVGTGTPWTTPILNATTSFWCEDVNVSGGAVDFGGKLNNDLNNGGIYNNNNRHQVFDAYEPFTIVSVKVYADGAGTRTFEVIEQANGNTVVQGTFLVPDGESRVTLNFDIPGPGEYGLRAVTPDPALWRDSQGSNPAYPFALGDVGSITRSTAGAGTSFYYFFYDWEVAETSVTCASGRTEVVVDVAVGVDELIDANGIAIWPNPSTGQVFVEIPQASGTAVIEVMDITGRMIRTERLNDLVGGINTIDLRDLSKGEYLLRAIAGEHVTTTKLVIE